MKPQAAVQPTQNIARPHLCPTCGQDYASDKLIVDLQTNKAAMGDRIVKLAPRDAEILFLLWEMMPRVASKDLIQARVEGLTEDYCGKWIDVRICMLRKRLIGFPLEIVNHHSRGWQLKVLEGK